jgi:toxin ParE1/3/4
VTARIRLSMAAEVDIVEILAWSERNFGPGARERYERLISIALSDIAAAPLGPGGAARPDLGEGARSWHLRASRERAHGAGGGVQRPRHFIIYRLEASGLVAIGRVLHDAMELHRHLRRSDWD